MSGRKSRFLFLIFTLFALKTGAAANICNYYLELEKSHPCGAQGYFQSLGWRYCQAYKQHEPEFSSETQLWLQKIRQCLIRKMEAHEEQVLNMTCGGVQRFALQTHYDCYMDFPLCRLPLWDQWRIFWIARWTMLQPDAWWLMVRAHHYYCRF